MKDIEKYFLNTVEAYGRFLEEMQSTPENRAYMDRVYRLLIDLPAGGRIEISRVCLPARLRKFIGCVELYFWDSGANKIEYSNDYKFIKKIEK